MFILSSKNLEIFLNIANFDFSSMIIFFSKGAKNVSFLSVKCNKFIDSEKPTNSSKEYTLSFVFSKFFGSHFMRIWKEL